MPDHPGKANLVEDIHFRKCKKYHFGGLNSSIRQGLLALVLMFCIYHQSLAQINCISAQQIILTDSGFSGMYQFSDSLFWFTFEADSTNSVISLYAPEDSSGTFVDMIEVYTGTCSQLTLDTIFYYSGKDSMISTLLVDTFNSNYYLKLHCEQNTPDTQVFVLSIWNDIPVHFTDGCICEGIENLLLNWDFDDVGFPRDSPPFNQSIIPGFSSDYEYCSTHYYNTVVPATNRYNKILITNTTNNTNPPWSLYYGLFNMEDEFLIADGHIKLGPSNQKIWEQTVETVQPHSMYHFRFRTRNLAGVRDVQFWINGLPLQYDNILPVTNRYSPASTDHDWHMLCGHWESGTSLEANIEIMQYVDDNWADIAIDKIEFGLDTTFQVDLGDNFTICRGNSDTVTIIAKVNGGNTFGNYEYHWSTSNTSSIFNYINVLPASTITYSVTVYDRDCDSWSTDDLTITVDSNPPPFPVIVGYNNDCAGNHVIYTIDGIAGNYEYLWSIIPHFAGIISNPTDSIVTITWNNLTPQTTLLLEKTDPAGGCTVSNALLVFPCCYKTNLNGILPLPLPVAASLIPQSVRIELADCNPKNYYIVINGTFTVDTDIIFNNCPHIVMGPNAKIDVANHSLQFLTTTSNSNYATSVHRCNDQYMWDGIYAATGAIVVLSGQNEDPYNVTTICDAQNAVVCYDSSVLLACGINFKGNYIGIKINETLNFNGLVQRCSFYTLPNGAVSNMDYKLDLPPHYGQYAFAGIFADKANNVFIGDNSTSMNMNLFQRLNYGIYATGSAITCFNNHFNEIPAVANYRIGSTYAGVFASTTDYQGGSFVPNLTIGGQAGDYVNGNQFNKCCNGVRSYGQSFNIERNDFTDCKTCIYCINVGMPSVIFNNTMSGISQNLKNIYTGIYVANPFLHKWDKLDINGNFINSPKDGISVTNLRSGLDYHFSIQRNIIHMSEPITNSNIRTGINIQNCDNSYINENTVDWDQYPSYSEAPYVRGLRISNSMGAWIYNNTFDKVGCGIHTNGLLLNTQFECNKMKYCGKGIFFGDYTQLSDQGSYFDDPHNKWETTSYYSYAGYTGRWKMDAPVQFSMTPIEWFYNAGSQDLDPNILPGNPVYQIIMPIHAIADNECQSIIVLPEKDSIGDTTYRESYLGKILRDEYLFQLLPEEFKAYEKELLYKVLLNDTAILYLGGSDDQDYQSVFDSLRNSGTGYNEKVLKLIQQGLIVEADSVNDLLSGIGVWEYNRKVTNRIYLQTWGLGSMEFPAEDSATLLAIAMQTPFEGGDAVYNARVMLQLDPECILIPYSFPINSSLSSQQNHLRVFPNPTREEVTIELDEVPIATVIISVYNETGEKVDELYLKSETNTIRCQFRQKAGYYTIKVELPGVETLFGKIVIIK